MQAYLFSPSLGCIYLCSVPSWLEFSEANSKYHKPTDTFCGDVIKCELHNIHF